jgi:hypothetical protein
MKTNIEVIDALSKYFLSQDPALIARGLANCMLDLQRFLAIGELATEDQCLLLKNVESLNKFIKDGPDGSIVFKAFKDGEIIDG